MAIQGVRPFSTDPTSIHHRTAADYRALRDLEALDHPDAQPARDWLRERRTSTGRWRGASPYRSKTWDLGPSGDTDRWISLHAALVV